MNSMPQPSDFPYYEVVCIDEQGKESVLITVKAFSVAEAMLSAAAEKYPDRQYRIASRGGRRENRHPSQGDPPFDERPTPLQNLE